MLGSVVQKGAVNRASQSWPSPSGDIPAGVRSRVLSRDRHVALVGADHPLAGRRSIDLARLADETFVDFPTDIIPLVKADLGL